ncbi:MAG TPA: class I SAM-dependent methyltransferase [Gemmataceae bacterium]|jgi:ubiquinone/menaquinone biosynthesis C-methylase UbiE|nr:class I SAM-dependent methyltransferase [Gemmataceae bacterium]
MAYATAEAKREFDRWSRSYDKDPLQTIFFRPAHRMLLAALNPGENKILDIGCGTGSFAARLLESRPQASVCGLDLSAGMLTQCHRRLHAAEGRLQLVRGDSQRLPFADNTFDALTCSHSFHHYPRQDLVAAEMHRVLRPGGRLFIVDGDRDRLWGRLVYDVVVVAMEGAVKHLSRAAFRALYAHAGFVNVQQQRQRGLLPFMMTVGEAKKALGGERVAA